MSYRDFRDLKTNACNKTGRPQTDITIPIPDKFEIWLLKGIRHYEKKGAKIELLKNGKIQIFWANTKKTVIRSIDDLKQEYKTEYLQKYYVLTTLPFEENAGVKL